MTSSGTAQTEDSVQVSLRELRQLEVARIEAEREAAEYERRKAIERTAEDERRRIEAEREADERQRTIEYERERQRQEAVHAHELAKEQARIAADARIEEKRLDLAIRKTEAEIVQAQALAPRQRRLGPILVTVAVVLVVQGALFWQQRAQGQRHQQTEVELAAVERSQRDLTTQLSEIENSVEQARQTVAEVETRPPAPAAPNAASGQRSATNGNTRPRVLRPPRKPPRPPRARASSIDMIDIERCAKTPLGCAE